MPLQDVEAHKSHDFIESVVKFYRTRSRRPCVYVSERATPPVLANQLKEVGFAHVDTEVWMFQRGDPQSRNLMNDLVIARVDDDFRLAQFLAVLKGCFRPDYAAAVEREFRQYQVHKSVEHVIATVGGIVRGIGSLYTAQGHSIIHNVATPVEFRKQGVATTILSHLTQMSRATSARVLYLQCEAAMEAFYAARGFQAELRRHGYVLDAPERPGIGELTPENANGT